MKKIISLTVGLLLALGLVGCGGSPSSESSVGGSSSSGSSAGGGGKLTGTLEYSDDLASGFLQTAATDDYGRSFGQVNGYNDNVVGIFYFLWLSQASVPTTVDSYVSQGKAENTLKGDEVPLLPTFTYWGEPMYGFYQVEDEWVVRKHVELFINAGLDFICFDCTNNDYYQAAAKTVLDVLLEYEGLGYDVPKAMFMTNTDSTGMTESIYDAFYRRDKYDSVWFTGNGSKPWIIANYGGDREDVLGRFYFKPAQWPNRTYNERYFPWISWKYPQETFTDAENGYNIMSVSVSQHTGIGGSYGDAGISGVNFSLSGLFSPYNYDTLSDELKSRVSAEKAVKYYNANRGRGWSNAAGSNDYEKAEQNVNFEEQWDTVWKNPSVNLVFITGWNEWIAQKQSKDPLLGDDYGYFVDTYNMEFSRDVEMMSGGYLDNCFLQMVKNVRKFKGTGHNDKIYHTAVAEGTDMLDLANWKEIASYADLVSDTKHRDYAGIGQLYYTNDTGRNDIREVRVTSDSENLWFLVSASDDITEKEASDTRWMNLWIGIEGADGGWNGLQYVVNRRLNGTASGLDRISDGKFEPAGTCETYVSGNVMAVKVPKSAVGITGNSFGLKFKVTDNLQKDFDVTDLYTNGDAAPVGRINYSYYTK